MVWAFLLLTIPSATVPGPADACAWVAEDVAAMKLADPASIPYQRYLWIPPWCDADDRAAVIFAVNTAVSSSHAPQKPALLAGGWLLRWDLRLLAPNEADRIRVTRIWDGLSQVDPYFHEPAGKIHSTASYVSPHDGKTYSAFRVGVLGVHLGKNGEGLRLLTGDAPGMIYRADWFLGKCLSTLNDGRYYEFAGIERKPAKGTAFDAFLRKLGSSEDENFRLGGENRAGLTFSGVTGKSRRADVFRGLAGLNGQGVISVTHDLGESAATNERKHPLLNLLKAEDDAREVIAEKPNGFHYFVLFDGKGNLQDEAPANVVTDHTVPPPHSARLQAAIACIRCHGPSDGWMPIRNDVRTLLSGRFAILDDLAGKQFSADELRDRLNTAYAYDPDRPDGMLDRARRDYARVLQSTCGLEPAPLSAATADRFKAIVYDLVTPEIACMELGEKLDDPFTKAEDRFAELIGKPPAISGVIREDVFFAMLRTNIPIQRIDWESRYRIAALRAALNKGAAK